MACVDIEMGKFVVSTRSMSRVRVEKLPAPSYEVGVPGLRAIHAVPLMNNQDGVMSDDLFDVLWDIEGL